MEFDHVLRIVGEFGPHQRKLYVLLSLSVIPAAFQMLIHVFVGARPEWTCSSSSKNESCAGNRSGCLGERYASKFTSIVTEWDLVCDQAYKVDLVQSVLMAGSLFGAVIFGALADIYGRRKIWYITLTSLVAFGFASSFAPNYKIYLILRFFTGLFIGGEILSAFVLATELIGPSYRGFAGTMIQCFFTAGLLILPVMSYLIRDWRTLSVVLSLPGSVFVLFFRYVPESARWLMIRGRVSEAEDILSDIAMKNGIAVPKMLLQVSRPLYLPATRYGCLDLIKTKHVARKTVVLVYLWFVNSVVYYGVALNTRNLGGDMYMNFFLSSMMEVPAYLTSVCFVGWLGRRRSLCYYMVLGGTACLGCLFVQTGDTSVYRTLTTIFAMIGKFGIAASFAVIYIFSAELLPTVVRNVGMGVCSMAARIGSILAPFVVFLGNYTRPLPMVLLGMCSVSAGVLALILPETLNKPLPETLEDTHDFSHTPYEQVEMEHLTFVSEGEQVFQANESDFEDELVNEKTTFI